MDARKFHLNPSDYGMPTRDELVAMRIWDSHYHGFQSSPQPIKQHEETMYYVERMGIERVVAVDVGGTWQHPLLDTAFETQKWEILVQHQDRVSGLIPIEPSYPGKSLAKMEKWIRHGPCIGIKYSGGNEAGVNCDHPNNDAIIKLAVELNAVIYIHTWIKVGGKAPRAGGGNSAGESSPMDIARLAQRYPDVSLICGHSGGDWELGVRAIRPFKNVLLEFAGSDPHSGSVDYAVRQLGADRIVWGGHGPSRSFATELGKILDADLTKEDRMKVFGGNYRRLAAPIFRKKGLKIVP
jgi:predicted TIM-barrel fold metal-dependent hydrolase